MNDDGEIKLFVRVPKFMIIFQIACFAIFFVGTAVRNYRTGTGSKIYLIMTVPFFFHYLVLLVLTNKFDAQGYVINGKGILCKNVYRKKFCAWDDIAEILVEKRGGTHILKFRTEKSMKNRIFKDAVKIMPLSFGITVDELREKINGARGFEYIKKQDLRAPGVFRYPAESS